MTDISPTTTEPRSPRAVTRPPSPATAEPIAPSTTEPALSRPDEPAWWRWTRRVFAALLLLVMVGAWLDGLAVILVLYGPIVVLGATVAQRISAKIRGRLVTGFHRDMFAPANRPYLVQMHIRGPLAVLVTLSASVALARQPGSEYFVNLALVAIPAFLFAQLQAIPARPVSRSLNAVALVAVAFLAFQLVQIHFRSGLDNAVSIAAPFESGEWTVVNGGPSTLVNGHYGPATPQQHDAIDFVIVGDGRTHEGDADDPASYHAWDQAIVAPADGTVVDAENGLRDHPIGGSETEPERARGNYVVIDIGDGHFVTLAHLRQGTVTVTEGDQVVAGQVVARLGNSGNTTEPHLHLQIQDVADVPFELFASGVETFPIHLTDVTHVRGGTEHADQTSQLRRNDIIRVDGQTSTESDSESEQP